MAATAFTLYNAAKRDLIKGLLDLDAGGNLVRAYLQKSTSNASTTGLILYSSVTNAVSGGGYTGAKTLGSLACTLSGDAAKYDGADPVYTASSGAIGSIMYLVIAASGASGNRVICWSRLSGSVFNVSSGNTLTIQFNSAGIFSLT